MQVKKVTYNSGLILEVPSQRPNSASLIERDSLIKAISAPSGSAAMNEKLSREAFAQAIVIPRYTDACLNAKAERFGEKVRAL
jgi:hypothetical protein